MASIKFCDNELLDRLARIEILKGYFNDKSKEIENFNRAHGLSPSAGINGRQLTNIGAFRAYVERYLEQMDSIHKEGLSFIVGQLAPGPKGLPIEIYAFTKTIEWSEYEQIQANIFDHLSATLNTFDLRVFQEPTSFDFKTLEGVRRL
jgi:miniconductance mechanosensitive channel